MIHHPNILPSVSEKNAEEKVVLSGLVLMMPGDENMNGVRAPLSQITKLGKKIPENQRARCQSQRHGCQT